MRDFRTEMDFALPSLWSTDELAAKLKREGPMTGTFIVERKLDGQRCTLQMGPSGCFLVSRSRHDKTKGVDVSHVRPFVQKNPENWMKAISDLLQDDVILDGELCVAGGVSTSSDVTRSDTEKVFVAFDIVKLADDLLVNLPLDERKNILMRWRELVASTVVVDRLLVVDHEVFHGFDVVNLGELLGRIKSATDGLEGFVLKDMSVPYKFGGHLGWKIKIKETEDGFIVACNNEKKHSMGVVTKTDRAGSVALAQIAKDGKAKIVAWVGLPEELRCAKTDFEKMLKNRVIEFEHRGWDGIGRFRFPRFLRVREDKDWAQCFMKVEAK